MEVNKKQHTINSFNPVIYVDPNKWRDYLVSFNVGRGNYVFTDYLTGAFLRDRDDGDCVTYVIVNKQQDDERDDSDIVGFFSLSTNAIPYISRIYNEDLGKHDEEMWEISAIEIKMFAIDVKYQDLFYEYEGEILPVAAWCLHLIVELAQHFINNTVGFKALFLHSVPEAEKFYLLNGFKEIETTMIPLSDVDSDCKPLWMPLRRINPLVFDV